MADLSGPLGFIFKGDVPGHVFHGNQYTSGEASGAEGTETRTRRGKGEPDPKEAGVTVLHATLEEHLQTIAREGLAPGAGGRNYDPERHLYAGGRSRSVFVSTEEWRAQMWAGIAMKAAGAKFGTVHPVILTIRIPKAQAKRLRDDEEGIPGTDLRLPGKIPPEWIVGAKMWTVETRGWAPIKWPPEPKAKADDGTETVYLVQLFRVANEKANVAEFTRGDVVGHPFRGNQYADGEGGSVPTEEPDSLVEWGESHDNSQSIAHQAASLMGIEGYEEVYTGEDADVLRQRHRDAAAYILDRIANSPGVKEPLYHGFENTAGIDWKVGGTIRLPLSAAADKDSARAYAASEEPTVFEFSKGTKAYGYTHWESIVAGEFRVTGVRRWEPKYEDEYGRTVTKPTVTVVSLEPTGYFDPRSKAWRKLAGAKAAAWAPDLTAAYARCVKGDFAGHPFRGNQWTDGEGGGGDIDARRSDAERRRAVEEERQYERDLEVVEHEKIKIDTRLPGLRKMVNAEAKRLGIDPKKVRIEKWPDESRIPGGAANARLTIAGYDPVSDEIMFYQTPMWMMGTSLEAARTALAHEVQHRSTHQGWGVIQDQLLDWRAAANRDGKRRWVKPGGEEFTSEARKRWPEMTEFLESGFNDEKGLKALLKECRGISNYTDEWIDQANRTRDRNTMITAAGEALSEVARNEADGEPIDAILRRRPKLAAYRSIIRAAAAKYKPKRGKR